MRLPTAVPLSLFLRNYLTHKEKYMRLDQNQEAFRWCEFKQGFTHEGTHITLIIF